MCILFAYVSKNVTQHDGKFKLILINNRDEYFHRPAFVADYIDDHNLYATDLTPGKEGGTWLGISKKGRIGVLLNLDQNHCITDPTKQGRGNLVPNYLNTTEDAKTYINRLSPNASNYNLFNLVLFEKSEDDTWNTVLFNNYEPKTSEHNQNILSLSNHLFHEPYTKTIYGNQQFEKIINTYNQVSSMDLLQEKLLDLLKTGPLDGPCMDDKQSKGSYDDQFDVTDRIFVQFPNYGTRTHTIILIDDKNKVYFNEYTLQNSLDGSTQEWSHQRFEFNLIA